jgi:hypothetical protein
VNRSWTSRRHHRYTKGVRRIRLDRAEHLGSDDFSCECFCEDASHGKGRVFSRFADTPKHCSCWMCSNLAWGPWDLNHFVPDLSSEDRDDNGETNRQREF